MEMFNQILDNKVRLFIQAFLANNDLMPIIF